MLISDPRSPPACLHARWATALLNDPRDVAFVGLMMECAVAAGFGVALFFSGSRIAYLGPAYWALLLVWLIDRFTLMLHCTSHRPLFRPKYRKLNLVIPWLLGPFFGQTPQSYFAHHLGMHHREENLSADLSSTMPFRRDRFGEWLKYYLRFLGLGLFDLHRYFRRSGQRKLQTSIVVGEGAYWLLVIALLLVRPAATFVVLIGPLLFMRTLMMMGNWAQHSLVCSEQPENPYRASITCINTRYNRRCFNDGYHVVHHLRANCHWTEHPLEFERNLAEYGKQDSIVFDGVDFFQVWLYLMTRRWSLLSKAFVQLPEAPTRNREEVIAFLRLRVGAIGARHRAAGPGRAAAPAGAALSSGS